MTTALTGWWVVLLLHSLSGEPNRVFFKHFMNEADCIAEVNEIKTKVPFTDFGDATCWQGKPT